MADFDPAAWEEALIADMRAHGGRPSSGPLAGHPLLVMTVPGARSGTPRRKVLTYSRDNGDYIVAGTANGSPKPPAWLFNVRANPELEIEIGNTAMSAQATEVVGSERDRLWEQHVQQLPWFADYPAQTGRVIPIVRLTPQSEG
jgi:deazaflavin-dependent oxidoreductase (nitroreductase family)